MRSLIMFASVFCLSLPAWAQAPGSQPASAAASGAPKAKVKPKKKSARVKLTFGSRPSGARVYYGRKQLGVTPFSLNWKRDSGPLDLVYKRGGYFNVNTRIYTDDDEKLIVGMTPKSKAYTLFGYKAPIKKDEPEDEGETINDPETGEPAKAPGTAPAKAPASGLKPVAPRPPGSIVPVAPKAP